jgi:ribonucleoside-diphosphate reductase alpha chain
MAREYRLNEAAGALKQEKPQALDVVVGATAKNQETDRFRTAHRGVTPPMQTDTLPRTSVIQDSQAPTLPPSASIAATAPGQLRVIKRNGTVVTYDDSKIAVAMTKAFLAVEGGTAAASSRIREQVRSLVDQMSATFERRFPSGGTLHIEDIQDQVELALMRSGEHKVARDYVLYRDSRARARAERKPTARPTQTNLSITRADGSRAPLDVERLRTVVNEACAGLKDVDGERIIAEALNNMYDGISEKDVATSVLITARTLVEEEPNYTFVTARILLDDLRAEALAFLGVQARGATPGDFRATQSQMRDVYPVALKAFIERGAQLELVSSDLRKFDLEALGAALKPERDHLFTYLGLQTLYDRYFIHSNDVRFELPQVFFMRVAMGLTLEETDRTARAIEFYDLLSSFDYMSSTPTLFNAGTLRSQAVVVFPNNGARRPRRHLRAIHDNAMLSKWPAVSATTGHRCARSARTSRARTASRRRGAVPESGQRHRCGGEPGRQAQGRRVLVSRELAPRHRRVHRAAQEHRRRPPPHARHEHRELGPDLFMKRVFEDGTWTLFSPTTCRTCTINTAARSSTPTRVRAQSRNRRVAAVQARPRAGSVAQDAVDAVRNRASVDHVQGRLQHPLAAAARRRGALVEPVHRDHAQHVARRNRGVQPRFRQPGQHVTKDGLDLDKLRRTVRTAVRMLDNVIDINYYSVAQARDVEHAPPPGRPRHHGLSGCAV